MLKNIIYMELLRRGYDVRVGKVNNREVDFAASSFSYKFSTELST